MSLTLTKKTQISVGGRIITYEKGVYEKLPDEAVKKLKTIGVILTEPEPEIASESEPEQKSKSKSGR